MRKLELDPYQELANAIIIQAAKDFDFNTSGDVITGEKEVVACLRRGDLLSVGHVLGHIALLDGVSEDGKYVHVVDSALSATYERLASRKANIGHIYYRNEDGTFTKRGSATPLRGGVSNSILRNRMEDMLDNIIVVVI